MDLESGELNVSHSHRGRHLCWLLLLIVVVAVIAIVAVIAAFTVFHFRDPTSELVSTSVSGVSPQFTMTPALNLELNMTLNIAVRIHNPNYFAFSHQDPGSIRLLYRGTHVGDAEVWPGHIPGRGSELLLISLIVEVDQMVPKVEQLIKDILSGEVAFDTETRLPGRLSLLGFERHAVATSRCHVVIGLPELKVRRTVCTRKTTVPNSA